jgi:SsrA-binding protein
MEAAVDPYCATFARAQDAGSTTQEYHRAQQDSAKKLCACTHNTYTYCVHSFATSGLELTRRARSDAAQEILEDFEAGISLYGTEVKSCRQGKCMLRDGYCRFKDGECWLHNVNIGRHETAGAYFQHEETRKLLGPLVTSRPVPARAVPFSSFRPPTLRIRLAGPRRLLLHKREIAKLQTAVDVKGLTVVPLAAYFNEKSFLKVKIGLGRGKKLQDKREDLKRRDMSREISRQVKAFG